MASKPNPAKRAKRIANKAKNEQLRKEGKHPKQLRDAANLERSLSMGTNRFLYGTFREQNGPGQPR